MKTLGTYLKLNSIRKLPRVHEKHFVKVTTEYQLVNNPGPSCSERMGLSVFAQHSDDASQDLQLFNLNRIKLRILRNEEYAAVFDFQSF